MSRIQVVGIVNVTPDSFSDGGRLGNVVEAVAFGRRLVDDGADVLDVGGESTRPGAQPVDGATERQRVLPVIEGLRRAGVTVPISIDTRKADVADAALAAGASIVNDVTAGTGDPRMLEVVARRNAGIVLMHMKGEPGTMQKEPHYDDVVGEVARFLVERAKAAEHAGISSRAISIDPGIGFGKTFAHNEELLRRLEVFTEFEYPVWLGASRKGFLGAITGRPVNERLAASLACVARAVEAGVSAIRVHDARETADFLKVLDRIHRT